ncbi:MAG TPA: Mur ligase family protein [Thermoanaerobaculia bacterium]|jgi:dihydrofolate synthase/folylpolyglutamate synthase|nr:Mur ligase family protein [Thermoanaerobaculia bacterium]
MSPLPAADDILARLAPLGMRLGLAPFRRLLATLGEPQRRLPAVLVAGTNGKGSTAALLAGIGCAAGYRTGLYTSPHLEEPRERIRVDGLALPTLELDRLLAVVVAAAGDEPPTPFEALTAAAFVAFVEAGVELAVLEVGLGGRLDATNATEPVLSLVTTIGLDHQAELGDTLAAIAAEKAGIFRAGRPALAAGGDSEVTAALQAAAATSGAALRLATEEAEVVAADADGLAGQWVQVRSGRSDQRLRLPLAGRHQQGNLLLAVLAAERLAGLGWDRLDEAAVARGVAGCRWAGRLEAVALPGGPTVLLDGAHNPAGAAELAEFLAALALPYDLVFGTLADKDAAGMAALLAPPARRVLLAPPDAARALPLASLAALPPLAGAIATPGAAAALDRAIAGGAPLVVVSGSLYLVGEARRWLRQQHGVPAPAAELPTWEPA